jgi:hypothetical protein
VLEELDAVLPSLKDAAPWEQLAIILSEAHPKVRTKGITDYKLKDMYRIIFNRSFSAEHRLQIIAGRKTFKR